MEGHGDSARLATTLRATRPTDEGHRVTTFELFFDLVYVFAVTQVTHFMAEAHSAYGILQGLLLLAMLWWTWGGYTWLGNQARADEASLERGWSWQWPRCSWLLLTIPEAWDDVPGGLDGPLVLVSAYLVKFIHLTVYAAAARVDAGLRRQLTITWAPTLAGAALLVLACC